MIPNRLPFNTQFSISKMMQVTAMAAVWFGVFQFAPGVALALIGLFVTVSWAILQNSTRSLQWLPLAAAINVLACILFESRTTELIKTVDLLQMFVASLVFMFQYGLKHLPCASDQPKGLGLHYHAFLVVSAAGFLSGLWLALPFFVVGALNEFVPQLNLPNWLIEAGFKMMVLGTCTGTLGSLVVWFAALRRRKPVPAVVE